MDCLFLRLSRKFKNNQLHIMRNFKVLILIFLILLFFFDIDPVYAGPGGTVVKAIFKTWWGKLILFIIAVIFLPLIIYTQIREYLGVRKAKKQLFLLSKINKDFSWLHLDKTVRNIFSRVYIAWNNEKMNEVSEYVSSWYWQNQQLVVLDQWKKENLRNICQIEKIKKVKPLYLEITSEENLNGSRIAFSIEAVIKDYLVNRESHRVVKGKNSYDDEEKIWILEYNEGKWVLDDIQDSSLSLAFAKMKNIIPFEILNSDNKVIKGNRAKTNYL